MFEIIPAYPKLFFLFSFLEKKAEKKFSAFIRRCCQVQDIPDFLIKNCKFSLFFSTLIWSKSGTVKQVQQMFVETSCLDILRFFVALDFYWGSRQPNIWVGIAKTF